MIDNIQVKTYTHYRHGVTIHFDRMDKNTNMDNILEEVLQKKTNVVRIQVCRNDND